MTTGETSRRVSRRSFLAGAATATLAGAAGCTSGSGAGAQSLTVSVWSGTYADAFRETVKPVYEDRTGNTLEVVGNWSGILSKVRSAPADDPPYDVTIGGPRVHFRGAQDDLWQPVRYDRLSNDDAIKPRLMEYEAAQAALPVNYGLEVYVFDESRVDAVPEAWDGIHSASNVALSGFNFSHPLMMAAIVMDEKPLIEEVYDPSYHDQLFEFLGGIDLVKFYSGSQDMWTSMRQGVIDVAQWYLAYSLEKDKSTDDLDIGVHVPETTVGYVDYYQVVRGADRELAEEFLDILLAEEAQSAFAEQFSVGMANENVSYPERSRELLPTSNEELQQVAFMEPERIADFDSDLEERYTQLQERV
jgi:spermidine/putrescine transport system substrate-binding protein